MPVQRWKNTSITTKAWRHEHLNGTLFDETEMEQDEPPEETDLILHDDDDDDDTEDPESTGTAVAEANTQNASCQRCAYGKHPPKVRLHRADNAMMR